MTAKTNANGPFEGTILAIDARGVAEQSYELQDGEITIDLATEEGPRIAAELDSGESPRLVVEEAPADGASHGRDSGGALGRAAGPGDDSLARLVVLPALNVLVALVAAIIAGPRSGVPSRPSSASWASGSGTSGWSGSAWPAPCGCGTTRVRSARSRRPGSTTGPRTSPVGPPRWRRSAACSSCCRGSHQRTSWWGPSDCSSSGSRRVPSSPARCTSTIARAPSGPAPGRSE